MPRFTLEPLEDGAIRFLERGATAIKLHSERDLRNLLRLRGLTDEAINASIKFGRYVEPALILNDEQQDDFRGLIDRLQEPPSSLTMEEINGALNLSEAARITVTDLYQKGACRAHLRLMRDFAERRLQYVRKREERRVNAVANSIGKEPLVDAASLKPEALESRFRRLVKWLQENHYSLAEIATLSGYGSAGGVSYVLTPSGKVAAGYCRRLESELEVRFKVDPRDILAGKEVTVEAWPEVQGTHKGGVKKPGTRREKWQAAERKAEGTRRTEGRKRKATKPEKREARKLKKAAAPAAAAPEPVKKVEEAATTPEQTRTFADNLEACLVMLDSLILQVRSTSEVAPTFGGLRKGLADLAATLEITREEYWGDSAQG